MVHNLSSIFAYQRSIALELQLRSYLSLSTLTLIQNLPEFWNVTTPGHNQPLKKNYRASNKTEMLWGLWNKKKVNDIQK